MRIASVRTRSRKTSSRRARDLRAPPSPRRPPLPRRQRPQRAPALPVANRRRRQAARGRKIARLQKSGFAFFVLPLQCSLFSQFFEIASNFLQISSQKTDAKLCNIRSNFSIICRNKEKKTMSGIFGLKRAQPPPLVAAVAPTPNATPTADQSAAPSAAPTTPTRRSKLAGLISMRFTKSEISTR